jgi:hypothetical protein
LAAKEFTKKKRKSMMELKKYTGSASKKSKRDSNEFKVGQRKEGIYGENDESNQA